MPTRWTATLIRALILLAGTSLAARAQPQPSIAWVNDWSGALETAEAQKRPLLIDFYADWCKPCRAMDKSVWTDGTLIAATERVVPVRIDLDKNRKLVDRFKVRGIPAMVFLDPWGNEIGRAVGYTRVDVLVSAIEGLPDDFRVLDPFQARIRSDPKDGEALLRVGAYYRAKRLLLISDIFLGRALDSAKNGKTGAEVAEEALVGLGSNHLSRKEYKEARETFERAVKKLPPGPSRPHALYGLVMAHLELGNRERALEWFDMLKASYPDFEGTVRARVQLQIS